MDDVLTVTVPCKRYVAHYLRSRFGNKPRLSHNSHLGVFFLNLLDRKIARYENRIEDYEDRVEIEISVDDMTRYGHSLTKTAQNSFNSLVEDHVKSLFEVHMDALVNAASFKKAHAIRAFQEMHDFPEHAWPFESLKKHYDRINKNPNLKRVA